MKLIFAVVERDRMRNVKTGTFFTCCYPSITVNGPYFFVWEKGLNDYLARRLSTGRMDDFSAYEPVVTFKKPTFLQRIKEKICR